MYQYHDLKDQNGEVWRSVLDYEGLYVVSNMGRVKSLKRKSIIFSGFYRTVPEKILHRRPNKRGYIRIELSKMIQDIQERKIHSVHRLVAEAFHPNPENKETVNHLNCITWDNRADNLAWATQQEQVMYGRTYGNGGVKFSKSKIDEIRKLFAEGVSGRKISSLYGISYSYASLIKLKKVRVNDNYPDKNIK